MHTKKIQHFAEAAFWPAALLRRASVLAEGQNLGAGGIHFRRACEVLTVSIKITTPKGVVIFMKPNFNLDIFDISDITLQFSKAPYIVSL